MNFYVITDTHFGHEKIHEFCDRPKGFENRILTAIHHTVSYDDVLIHLGDICWGDDVDWHIQLKNSCPGKMWLVRGNHDKKSTSWYLSHGWDCVVSTLTLKMFGQVILMSHKPQIDTGYDINIHGHFHNNDFRNHESDLRAIKNNKQKLVMIEHGYRPFRLKELCSNSSSVIA